MQIVSDILHTFGKWLGHCMTLKNAGLGHFTRKICLDLVMKLRTNHRNCNNWFVGLLSIFVDQVWKSTKTRLSQHRRAVVRSRWWFGTAHRTVRCRFVGSIPPCLRPTWYASGRGECLWTEFIHFTNSCERDSRRSMMKNGWLGERLLHIPLCSWMFQRYFIVPNHLFSNNFWWLSYEIFDFNSDGNKFQQFMENEPKAT